MKQILIIISVALLFAGCRSSADVNDFSWLKGHWRSEDKGTIFYERWGDLKDGVMDGSGCAVSNKDTVFTEILQISKKGDAIYYTAIVPSNDGTVDFKFTGYKNDTAVFENPTHDFPQRILYYKKDVYAYYVAVDGYKNKKYGREEFSFMKIR